jgi:hypothetical protein
VVNISGALLSFGGTGSTVTVSNALHRPITNAIQNAAGNTVSIAAGAAAVRVDGATTWLTISGQ